MTFDLQKIDPTHFGKLAFNAFNKQIQVNIMENL